MCVRQVRQARCEPRPQIARWWRERRHRQLVEPADLESARQAGAHRHKNVESTEYAFAPSARQDGRFDPRKYALIQAFFQETPAWICQRWLCQLELQIRTRSPRHHRQFQNDLFPK